MGVGLARFCLRGCSDRWRLFDCSVPKRCRTNGTSIRHLGEYKPTGLLLETERREKGRFDFNEAAALLPCRYFTTNPFCSRTIMGRPGWLATTTAASHNTGSLIFCCVCILLTAPPCAAQPWSRRCGAGSSRGSASVWVMDLPEGLNPSSLQNSVRTEAPEHVDEIQDHEVAAPWRLPCRGPLSYGASAPAAAQ